MDGITITLSMANILTLLGAIGAVAILWIGYGNKTIEDKIRRIGSELKADKEKHTNNTASMYNKISELEKVVYHEKGQSDAKK